MHILILIPLTLQGGPGQPGDEGPTGITGPSGPKGQPVSLILVAICQYEVC